MVMLGGAAALQIAATAVVFSTGGTSPSADELGIDDWFRISSLLLMGVGSLVSLILSVLDTADHDHEFNLPWAMGFVACCVPVVNLIMPFAFLAQVITSNTWLAGTDGKQARFMLWLWFGLNALSFVAGIGMEFELIGQADGKSPVMSLMESGFTTMANLVGIVAIGSISESIVLARKAVIRSAVAASASGVDPYTGQPLNPNSNDPFWPGI